MTGGSKRAKEINQKLAAVAEACGILFVTGSYSAGHEGSERSIVCGQKDHPRLLLATNIGIDKEPELGFANSGRATTPLSSSSCESDARVAHAEGERIFHTWKDHLRAMAGLSVPVVPEGSRFGMDPKTVQAALDAGITTVDISGRGGN